MKSFAFWQLCVVSRLGIISVSAELSTLPQRRRQVWAWAGGDPQKQNISAQVEQLQNETWTSVLDGIELLCGAKFTSTGIAFNNTVFEQGCGVPIVDAINNAHTRYNHTILVQFWIAGALPLQEMSTNMKAYIEDAVRIYQILDSKYGLKLNGFSLDDESHCAPAANSAAFEAFVTQQSQFASGLKTAIPDRELFVTSAVQALFGIQEQGTGTDPCSQLPSSYPQDSMVTNILSNTNDEVVLQKWLVMDTYYFSTARFLAALEWYATYIPTAQLALGIMNRDDLSPDDLATRFYALHFSHPDINWINVFMLPMNDQFYEYLKRWKTYCRGCGPQASTLGCLDMSITCDYETQELAGYYEGDSGDYSLIQTG